MLIFLFEIIICIILLHSRDNFEAFLRYNFSQNTNYKSSTVSFKKEWRAVLHVGISESSLEIAVLDRQDFFDIKWSKAAELQSATFLQNNIFHRLMNYECIWISYPII